MPGRPERRPRCPRSSPPRWCPLARRGGQKRAARPRLTGDRRLFARIRLQVLLTLTAVSALFAPLGFLGGFSAAVAGGALWGLGMVYTSPSSPPPRSCQRSEKRPPTEPSRPARARPRFLGVGT